jgi:uncharacterized SAM-binding protein YcdF (DUF218 family)
LFVTASETAHTPKPGAALRRIARVTERILALFGLLILLVVASPLVSWWAKLYAGPIDQPKGDVLILLSAASDEYGGISYSSYWRARQALVAWQTGGFKNIVISGGKGPGIYNFLLANGIPRSAMIAEWGSTGTRESGIAVARLLRNMPGKRVLLTSDYHMYRAIRVFRKVGVEAAPMAVPDVLHSTEGWPGRFGACWAMAVETAKIVYYGLRGWI